MKSKHKPGIAFMKKVMNLYIQLVVNIYVCILDFSLGTHRRRTMTELVDLNYYPHIPWSSE